MRDLRRTSALFVTALLGAGLIIGTLMRPLAERTGGSAPQPGWIAAVVIFFAAVVVGVLARNTWRSLHQRRDRMTSDHAVKMLAVAKSSIIVGALFGGMYVGLALSFLDALDIDPGRGRVLQGGVAGLAGIALLVAGLLLERSLRLPGDDDEAKKSASGAPNPA